MQSTKDKKIDRSVLLSVIVVIGFFVYVGSNELMRRSLIQSTPNMEEKIIIGENEIRPYPKVGQVDNFCIDEKDKTNYLNIFPKTLLWISYHSLALALVVIAVIFLIFPIKSLVEEFQIKRKWSTTYPFIPLLLGILVLTLLLCYDVIKLRALISGNAIVKYFGIIFDPESNIVYNLVGTFLFLSVIPFFGIIIINISIKKLKTESKFKENISEHYRSLRGKLNIFALVIGFLVSISVIGTKLQKKMIGEQLTNIDLIYPDEFIYLYALTFTLVLALFFVPSLFYLKRVRVENNIQSDEEITNTGWWKVGKESMDDIKVIFSMILPLITSFSQII